MENLMTTVAFLEFRPVGNVRKTSENFGGSAILAVRPSLTGSRGEYFRVVGIHSDG